MGHLLCPAEGFLCHSAPKIVIASIVADRCFVDVTSVKLFAPELYLKQKQYADARIKYIHCVQQCKGIPQFSALNLPYQNLDKIQITFTDKNPESKISKWNASYEHQIQPEMQKYEISTCFEQIIDKYKTLEVTEKLQLLIFLFLAFAAN